MTASDWQPACFDAAELADWRAGRIGACADCEPGWHETSRGAGRCNGVPRFAAIPSEEDDMETPATYGGAIVATHTRVTVVAPCATCVHVRVCRLRPADELVVTAELPDLDRELDVTLTATVECMEYARASGAAPKKPMTDAQRAAAIASAAKAREAMARKRAEQKARAAA